VVQVWLSTGTVVAAEVEGVVERVSFKGGGVDAVHPARSITTMQRTGNTIKFLFIQENNVHPNY
jgi:hypothetical protein